MPLQFGYSENKKAVKLTFYVVGANVRIRQMKIFPRLNVILILSFVHMRKDLHKDKELLNKEPRHIRNWDTFLLIIAKTQ